MNLDAIIEKKTNELIDKLEKDYLEVANEVNEIGYKEANKIYDSFIKDYYSYETKSYIRHWEGRPGTGKGSNLYYGKNFKIHRGKNPYFELGIYDSKMADDYQYDSAIDVLTQIMAGANVITGAKGEMVWFRSWRGTYKSKYFQYSGTLDDALFTFLNEYDTMMVDMFKRRWKQKGW